MIPAWKWWTTIKREQFKKRRLWIVRQRMNLNDTAPVFSDGKWFGLVPDGLIEARITKNTPSIRWVDWEGHDNRPPVAHGGWFNSHDGDPEDDVSFGVIFPFRIPRRMAKKSGGIFHPISNHSFRTSRTRLRWGAGVAVEDGQNCGTFRHIFLSMVEAARYADGRAQAQAEAEQIIRREQSWKQEAFDKYQERSDIVEDLALKTLNQETRAALRKELNRIDERLEELQRRCGIMAIGYVKKRKKRRGFDAILEKGTPVYWDAETQTWFAMEWVIRTQEWVAGTGTQEVQASMVELKNGAKE